MKKYLPHYAKNATYEFIDNDFFTTTIYLDKDVDRETSQETGVKTRVKTRMKTMVKIIELINKNNTITRQELSEILGISLKGVDWQINNLKKQGVLKRIGPDKGGYWEVLAFGNDD